MNALLKKISSYLMLSAVAVLMILPFLWLASTSFKSADENIFSFPPQFIPARPTWDNYIKVWQNHPFHLYLFNSLVVSGVTVVLNLVFSALAAFPLARYEFRGRALFFWAIVGTTMIPFQITMIPLYILAVQLNLKNTYLGLIFPYVASAFGVFLLRQAFQGVPKELEEAARMDGCSPLGVWWYVMIPAIQPALTTLAVFTFVAMWGDFLWPLLILDQTALYTLPLGVANLASAFSADWRLIAAGSIIATLPIMIFFIALQRYFVPSQVGAGVKG